MSDTSQKPISDPATEEQDSITVNTDVAPELDPNSPEFDPEKWIAATEGATDHLKETLNQTNAELLSSSFSKIVGSGFLDFMEQMNETNRRIASVMNSTGFQAMQESIKNAQEVFEAINKSVAPTYKAMQDYFQSESWSKTREKLLQITENATAYLEIADELSDLAPFLEAELKKPDYEGKTLDDLFEEAEQDENGQPLPGLFMQALTAARAARDAAANKKELPRTAIKRAQSVEYPLDKPNSIIWNLLEKDTGGKVSFNMAKYGSKQSVPVFYAISFEDLEDDVRITKRLLPFDKLVYVATAALFNAGNDVITLSQIYYAMGYTGRPGTKDLTKINDALTKMATARIYFDNEQEAAKYKYDRFRYDGQLLPMDRISAIVNGQAADAAIRVLREPPLISFAKQRNQITTLDIKLLQAPLSKTDANLLIQDYLLERISRERNRKNTHSCRILYKTLYKHANITTRKQEQRAPAKIEKYLLHYIEQDYITRFTLEQDGITVYW